MSTITFTTNSNTYDASDKRAATIRVNRENDVIRAANQQLIYVNNTRAQNVPPLAAISDAPLLDTSTSAALKTSYEVCLVKDIAAMHPGLVQQANEQAAQTTTFKQIKDAFADATPDKQAAALAALK